MADRTEPARQRAGRHCRDACKLTGQGKITQCLEQWVIMAAEKAAAAGSSAPGEPLGGGVGLGAAAQVDLAGLLVHSHVVDLQEQAGGTPAGQGGGRSGGRATCTGRMTEGLGPRAFRTVTTCSSLSNTTRHLAPLCCCCCCVLLEACLTAKELATQAPTL